MDWTFFTGALAIVTFGIAIGIALYSKRKVDKRMHDKNAPKSTLAKDKDSKADPADV
jgi:preprotein translocase subunit SecG